MGMSLKNPTSSDLQTSFQRQDLSCEIFIILKAFSISEQTTWPPTADSLQAGANNIPKQLKSFLTILLCGKENSATTKVNRLVSSLGQDTCKATTYGQ